MVVMCVLAGACTALSDARAQGVELPFAQRNRGPLAVVERGREAELVELASTSWKQLATNSSRSNAH